MPQGPFLREYGTETKIPFVLFEVDGVDFRDDATPATADATVMIDEGAEASATNIYVDEGIGYSLTLTATEMLGARIVVYLVDAATKAFLDDSLIIETYGSASAMHPFPLGTATVTVGANNDKTGYTPATGANSAGTFGANALTAGTFADDVVIAVSSGTIVVISGTKQTLDALTDGSGVTITTNNDKAGYSLSGSLNVFDDMENLSAGTINAQVDTALSDIGLDNLIQVSAGASAATEGSYLDLIMNATSGGTFIQSTDSLEAIRNNQSDLGASATTIAAAVWGALIASYDVNDTFGNVINDLTEDNGGTHRFTTAALGQGPTGAGASSATIAAAVWDAFGSSHTIAGTFGVDAISLSADTIWDEVVDGITTARESLVISNTILAGKVSGGSSTTATFRDLADSKDRIVVVFTVDGDKTSVTFSDIAA